ncbi:MAG: CFI-box-CTERM domain-containing protein, partial [Candidatus Brocadiia bacterium]
TQVYRFDGELGDYYYAEGGVPAGEGCWIYSYEEAILYFIESQDERPVKAGAKIEVLAPNGPPAPPSQNGAVTSGGGGCFIATAAFGTISAESVRGLCAVRDGSLQSSSVGAAIVANYYAVSPEVAKAMPASFRAVVRRLIH